MKNSFKIDKRLWVKALSLVVLYMPIQEAFAQIEEILVTSRRFEESITDAPLAVAVFSDQYLKDNRVDSIQDILELTPGSNWGQFAKAQPALGMRGISSGSFGNASIEHAVSVVSDGVPAVKAFMMTLPVHDLERVEVLRGPQGTTFGRNATLGMMHFISARPSQEQSGSIEFSTGADNLFGINGHINGAITDELSARLAIDYKDTPGAIEDETTGDMLEDAEGTSVRASLLWEPTDSFSAYLKAEFVQDQEFPTVRRGKDQGVQWLTANYGSYVSNSDPWKATISDAPDGAPWEVVRDMRFLTAELTWLLDDDVAVTSITGHQSGSHYSNSDAFGTLIDIRDQLVWNDADVFSQEVRIDNQASGNQLRWLAGASYLTDEEFRQETNVGFPNRGNCSTTTPTVCNTYQLDTFATNTTTAFGIFGEVTYDLSDQLTLAVGGRYSSDERELDFSTWGWGASGGLAAMGLGGDPSQDCNAITAGGLTPGQCGTIDTPVGFEGDVSDSWDDFSGKISLSYAVNENNNVYALYSTGFKAGGFQQDSRTPANLQIILGAEGAKNLEFGWKGSYDNLVFALTLFKQEQTNTQTGNLTPVGTSNINLLRNSEGVKNTGIELEATWAVTDNLTFGGFVVNYSPEFIEGSTVGGVYDIATGVSTGQDVSGETPSGSTKKAATLFANYVWGLSDGSTLSIRGDIRHRGTVWGRNGSGDREALNLTGDGLANLRPELNKTSLKVAWRAADDSWGASVWGRNLDNEPDYINFGPGFGFAFLKGPNGGGARPVGTTGRRQIGATVDYSF
jgi:iron complex outermembrane receptor protein